MAGRVRGSGHAAAREGHLAQGRIKGLSSTTHHTRQPPDASHNYRTLFRTVVASPNGISYAFGPRRRSDPKSEWQRERDDDDLAKNVAVGRFKSSEPPSSSHSHARVLVVARRPPPPAAYAVDARGVGSQ